MIDKMNLHYSFTNPASVHDEEALTALELAGRQGAKINEVIDAQNNLNQTNEEWREKEGQVITENLSRIPNQVDLIVRQYIADGSLEAAIEPVFDALDKRINKAENDLQTVRSEIETFTTLPESSTTGDAEIADARVTYNGETFPNLGGAIRTQVTDLHAKTRKMHEEMYMVNEVNIFEAHRVNAADVPDTLTIGFNRDTQEITFNGYLSTYTGFNIIVESSLTPANAANGDFYLKWENADFMSTGKTWGALVYFSDGTSEDIGYTDTNLFLPIKTPNKRINRIWVRLGEGHSFGNLKTRIYTDVWNSGFVGYNTHYLPKPNENDPYAYLNGKRWCTVGDSITENSGNTGTRWQNIVADRFGMVHTNAAIGGLGLGAFLYDDLYKRIPTNVELITVMGGTNDHANNLPLENNEDVYYNNSGHFAGCIRMVAKKLQADFPNARVIFCTPFTARLNIQGVNQERPYKNALGLTIADYAETMIKTCRGLGIPCIDLCGESGINHTNAARYMTDRVHPNHLGYEKIAQVYITNFKKLLWEV